MPWFLTPHGPHFVVEPGTIDEYERRDYVQMTQQQVTDYYAGVAFPDPPSFATEAEVPGIVAGAVAAGTGPVSDALRAAFGHGIVLPETYGARGDGRLATDADTAGAVVTTSLAAAATVGQVVWLRNGGGAGVDFVSTVASRTSSTITLASAPTVPVTDEWIIVGTDDTAAMQDAIDAAMDENATLLLGKRMYVVAGAPRTDRSGNAVLALHTQYATIGAPTLRLLGIADAQSSWIDSQQGSTIFAPILGQTYSATYGPPSLIGGPTSEQIGGVTVSRNNVEVRDVFICLPQNPTLGALDFERVSRAYVDGVHCGVATEQLEIPVATHPCGFGVRMPGNLNFERVQIGTLLVDGYYIGGTSGEHLLATQISIHQCRGGWSLGGHAGHASHVDYFSFGRVLQHLVDWEPVAGLRSPVEVSRFLVDLMDTEEHLDGAWATEWNIRDADSKYRATIRYSRTAAGIGTGAWPLKVDGATQVKMVDASGPTERRVIDSSPLGRHAMPNGDPSVPTLVGSPVTGFGNALRLPGVAGVAAPYTSSIVLGDTRPMPFPFTVECRFSVDALTGYQVLLSRYTNVGGAEQDFAIFVAPDGHLNASVRDGSGTPVALTGTGAITAGTPHAVALVADGTNLMLYVDGTREAMQGMTTKQASPANVPLALGGGSDGVSLLTGTLDEVRISSTARYTGTSYVLATAPFTSDANTVALYHCDELR